MSGQILQFPEPPLSEVARQRSWAAAVRFCIRFSDVLNRTYYAELENTAEILKSEGVHPLQIDLELKNFDEVFRRNFAKLVEISPMAKIMIRDFQQQREIPKSETKKAPKPNTRAVR